MSPFLSSAAISQAKLWVSLRVVFGLASRLRYSQRKQRRGEVARRDAAGEGHED
jgi:hypothetical protein